VEFTDCVACVLLRGANEYLRLILSTVVRGLPLNFIPKETVRLEGVWILGNVY